jgi:hypothetical protein
MNHTIGRCLSSLLFLRNRLLIPASLSSLYFLLNSFASEREIT